MISDTVRPRRAEIIHVLRDARSVPDLAMNSDASSAGFARREGPVMAVVSPVSA